VTACSVTVLRCDPARRATKRVTKGLDGQIQIDGYDLGKYVAVTEHPVGGIAELARVLDNVAANSATFVVRAEPRPRIDRTRCRRLLHPDPQTHDSATFRDMPRQWVILDFDSVPGPYRFDPKDGELAAIYCQTLLPEPWQRCSYWWGLSSSAGFKPGVRIKLAFWLDRPIFGRELERHLKGCPIDVSTLRAVQPIYLARPILVGVADPIRQRTGVEQDRDDAVVLPVLPAEVRHSAPETHSPEGQRYVSGSTEDLAWKRLEALCGAVRQAVVGGRHRCLLWAAARAIELDDALPRAAIAEALIAAAQHAGLEDHEAELTRQVRNGFKLEIFGTEAAW
jgi:hypothetical protein